MEAVAKALVDFPMMNISVEGNTIIKKKHINIGMATALPDGNLIVPVIKNADALNLRGMVKTVNDLARRARAGQLKPDEVKDGTYTVTNIGSFSTLFGTPYYQSATSRNFSDWRYLQSPICNRNS